MKRKGREATEERFWGEETDGVVNDLENHPKTGSEVSSGKADACPSLHKRVSKGLLQGQCGEAGREVGRGWRQDHRFESLLSNRTPGLLPTLQLGHWWDPLKPGMLKQRTSGMTESRAYSTEQSLRKPLYLHPQTRWLHLPVGKPQSHPKERRSEVPFEEFDQPNKTVYSAPQVALVVKNLTIPTYHQPRRYETGVGWGRVSIPALGRSPGGGHGNPLQYSYLEKLQTEVPGGL